jgi:hypothetical protein
MDLISRIPQHPDDLKGAFIHADEKFHPPVKPIARAQPGKALQRRGKQAPALAATREPVVRPAPVGKKVDPRKGGKSFADFAQGKKGGAKMDEVEEKVLERVPRSDLPKVGGGSSKLKHLHSWTTAEVADFLRKLGLEKFAATALEKKLNGRQLLGMSKLELVKLLDMSASQAAGCRNAIEQAVIDVVNYGQQDTFVDNDDDDDKTENLSVSMRPTSTFTDEEEPKTEPNELPPKQVEEGSGISKEAAPEPKPEAAPEPDPKPIAQKPVAAVARELDLPTKPAFKTKANQVSAKPGEPYTVVLLDQGQTLGLGLKVDEKSRLKIEQLVPDSQAVHAGIVRGDILLSCEGRKFQTQEQAFQILRDAKFPLTLQLLRALDQKDRKACKCCCVQ